MFERKWVIFEEDIKKIPDGSLVVISAHGTGPSYFAALRAKNISWIDATCPLVEKVHKEARDLIKEWYHILYIGKKWHQEALWVIDEGEKHFTLIEKIDDLVAFWNQKQWNYSWQKKLALLTQTTLSVDDTARIIKRAQELFPDIVLPKARDICYATTNRQNAVKALSEQVEVVLVVGSKASSNSNKLKHVAEWCGKKAYLIDSADEIEGEWLLWIKSVWVTAWASGPEILVEGVVHALEQCWGKFERELRIVEEKMVFPYTLTVSR